MTNKEVLLQQCDRLDQMAIEVVAMQKLPGLSLHCNHQIGVATGLIRSAAQRIREALNKEK